ncbi:uncharacterized protein LOC132547102 [Ylistrum balloti]|uniref:uncharacterized protein LOC132547102 n=1 Tax=Ylistrum balloti TaxID=509963 RepID=UPI002905CF7B|nr:uncharacterized protein LOC132547102 [Ylistrum balloti]
MRLVGLLVFCLVTDNVEGFFGLGRFVNSGRKSMKRLVGMVDQEAKAYRRIFEQDVIPELKQTMTQVRTSINDVVVIADRIEHRLEETLQKVDELIGQIGFKINKMADLIIILFMAFLFVVIGSLCDNKQFILLYYSFQFIRGVCVITAMTLLVRLDFELVLRVDMNTASTIRYCLISPVVFVLVCAGLSIAYKALRQGGFAVGFILQGPRLIIYCTVDGPWRWTYGAYKYGQESKSKTGLLLSIFLPWLSLLICFGVFCLFAGDIDDEKSEQNAMLLGIITAYVFFLTFANHLRMFHLRPEPQTHMRNIQNQKYHKIQPNALPPAQGSTRPTTEHTRLRR